MYEKESKKIQKMLEQQNYIADSEIVMSMYLAKKLQKPLLVEGPAGAVSYTHLTLPTNREV